MKTLFKKLVTILLIVCVVTTAFACGKKNNDGDKGDVTPPPVVKDTDSAKITVDYEYKIVLKGTEVTLPNVSFDEEVTAKYQFDGETVTAGSKFTASEVGVKVYKITATDKAGNVSSKEVFFEITENAEDLNKIYSLDTVAGLNKQLGTSRNGINNLALYLISENAERPKDVNNKTVPNLYLDEDRNVVSEELANTTVKQYLKADMMTGGGAECRMVFSNPLYKNWNENFSQLYFYAYNAGVKAVTLYFNNWAYTLSANSGWQKVIIAPKTVDGEVVTDYTKISSLGNGYDYSGLFDLEDCVGATLRLLGDRYERVMLTSIYGVPVNE